MNRQVKKILKISGITLGSVLLVLLVAIVFVINLIVTPKKLAPVVLDAADQTLNAHLGIESIELTLFSTLPQFGLKVKNGSLVSRTLNDSNWCKTDSLLFFKECVLTVNPVAYWTENRIVVHNLSLDEVSVYAYQDKARQANWEVTRASANTIPEDTVSVDFNSEIDIRNIELKHANFIFDDRNTDTYSWIGDANLKLKLSLTKDVSTLGLKFDNKNILFWQQGELLVNKIATSLRTDITMDRQTAVWKLKDTELNVNGIQLDVNGAFHRDIVAKTIGMDLEYGLHAPPMETVLRMIPKAYVKDSKVSAKREVTISDRVKGMYGGKKLSAVPLKIGIKEASAQYKGLPYGIDEVMADLDAYVDLMRHRPSYLNLKIFHFKGAHAEVLVNAKVDDLLNDPLITFHTKSTVDLDALAKTFPLQESVTIRGKLDADMGMKCRLSTSRKQDIGRMKLGGRSELNDFELKDTTRDLNFLGNATFCFRDNETLQAQMGIRRLMLRSRLLSSDIERLVANVTSTNPQDTTRIVSLQCDMEVSKLHALMGDSIKLYSVRAKAQVALEPQEADVTEPVVDSSLRANSLFSSAAETRTTMNTAGIKVKAEKLNDSLWVPKGIVGFDRLRFRMPEFGLPICMAKTAVAVDGPKIRLKNASVRIGRPDMTATGDMEGVYRATMKGERLIARPSLISNLIDCNQLINSLSFPQDTTEVLTGSVPSEMKLFAIPRNIDFELQTDLKKVVFEKMLFENVHDAVGIKNQAIYLEDLSVRVLDADIKAIIVYKANSPRSGYAGFDLETRNINIAELADSMPSLDMIVPMLRSSKGRAMSDMAAGACLDSAMNIRIPTLRSAIHIKGNSLVLMDGETFAEISKMPMFKSKKENVFDSISANVTVHDGNVTVYPFLAEIGRYKAAVGGEQGLDMNFNYHISTLRSPLPFKAGVNITGNLDKMKSRIGKTKYKDAVTPAAVHRVDSTRVNMGNEIVNRFRRVVTGRRPR